MTSKTKKDIQYSDDVRLSLLEQSITHINETLIRFEHRFDRIDDEFKELRKEIKEVRTELKGEIGLLDSSLKAKINNVESSLRAEIKWIANLVMGLYAGAGIAVIGAAVKVIFHL